ncbi:sulfurtransferase TusA family protein [Synechococcus sp. RSCCF101]|nr:sulfurtransferase TusA family protein [Synechococcus sp. RSCCF101]
MEPSETLDLRGLPCPVNYIRTRLALEGLEPGSWLQVDLDAGEPEAMVSEGLRDAGHRVDVAHRHGGVTRLRIQRAAG